MKKNHWSPESRFQYFIFGCTFFFSVLFALYFIHEVLPNTNLRQLYVHFLAAFAFALLIVVVIRHERWTFRRQQAILGKLEYTEGYFRQLFATNPYPMWLFDRDTLKFVAVNDEAIARYGYSEQEFLHMTVLDIRPSDEVPQFRAFLKENSTPGVAFGDFRHRTKGGRIFDVEVVYQPLEIDGRPLFLVISQDITERKRAEAEIRRLNTALEQIVAQRTSELAEANQKLQFKIIELTHTQTVMRQREERFHSMIEDQTELISCSNSKGDVTFLNGAARKAYQLEGTLTRFNLYNSIYSEDVGKVKACFESLNHENPIGAVENRAIMPDGSIRWFMWTNRAVFDLNGNFMEFQAVGRDITDRKRREHELEIIAQTARVVREANTRKEIISLVTDQLVDALSMTGTALILYDDTTNESVYEQVRGIHAHTQGFHQPASVGLTGKVMQMRHLYVNQDISAAPEMAGRLEANDPRSVAAAPLISQGRLLGYLWISSYSQIRDDELRILVAIAEIAANALDRAATMETLESRVIERTSELEAVNTRLTQLDQLKTKFIHDISHEIRTPVSVLNTAVYLLEHSTPEKRDRYITTLKQQMTRLGDLIEDILNFSSLEESAEGQLASMVDLSRLLDEVVHTFKQRAELANLSMTFEPAREPIILRGNEDLLRHAFNNLLTNAINYTQSGSVSVKTTVNPDSHDVVVTIKDTGTGIAPEDLPFIFDTFYRGQQVGQFSTPGTGIGLSIVKRAVMSHGGITEVDSKLGEGSIFRIRLPLTQ